MSQDTAFSASPVKGEVYEPKTGRWSRLMAPKFLAWLDVPARGRWIDVGCGTGAVMQAILDTQEPTEIVGLDPSSAFIAFARRQIADPRVRLEVGTAQSLPVASDQFDAAVSGLVLHHIPSQERLATMQETVRVARPGGVVGAYVWDYADGMQLRVKFWEAASLEVDVPEETDERTRYPICQASPLSSLFERAGLAAVETTSLQIEAYFEEFDDYWSSFDTGYGVTSAFLLQQSPRMRERIRERLRDSLPISGDGTFTLVAGAWAVKGVKQTRGGADRIPS